MKWGKNLKPQFNHSKFPFPVEERCVDSRLSEIDEIQMQDAADGSFAAILQRSKAVMRKIELNHLPTHKIQSTASEKN